MKRSIIFASGFFLITLLANADESKMTHGIMRPDRKAIEKWHTDFLSQKKAEIIPKMNLRRGNLSLLEYYNFNSTLRDQGETGICWAWAGTGCLSISAAVQGIAQASSLPNGLSVQFIASNLALLDLNLDAGGDVPDVVKFYERVGYAIPWDNPFGEWQDGNGEQNCPSSWIETNPRFPINSIEGKSIATQTVSQADAIAAIKNVLNQNKPIFLGYYLPTESDWQDFSKWWDSSPESAVINFDKYVGTELDEDSGGHAVVCVGYNDDAPQLENQYWVMLNSWGNANGARPNACFHVSMNLDYGRTLENGDTEIYSYYWSVLDAGFSETMKKRFDSFSFSFNAEKHNGDSFLIQKFAFDDEAPSSISEAVLRLNSYSFLCDENLGTWSSKNGVFKFRSKKGRDTHIELLIDSNSKFWNAKIGKTSISRYVNYYDGLDFEISIKENQESEYETLGSPCSLMFDDLRPKSSGRNKNK